MKNGSLLGGSQVTKPRQGVIPWIASLQDPLVKDELRSALQDVAGRDPTVRYQAIKQACRRTDVSVPPFEQLFGSGGS
jgi:hypothetical protein